MNSKKVKALETRQKIYESASQLFRKHGFDHVSVDAIVKAAGVAKGSFYVHFKSKNFLITSLIADNVGKVDLDYMAYLQTLPADASATDQLMSLIEKVADTISNTIGYDVMRIIYEVQLTKTVNTEAMLSYSRDIYKVFSKVIQVGIEQGEFKPKISTDQLANHLIMNMRGMTYEWCIRYPDFDLRQQFQSHFELLLSGIKKL